MLAWFSIYTSAQPASLRPWSLQSSAEQSWLSGLGLGGAKKHSLQRDGLCLMGPPLRREHARTGPASLMCTVPRRAAPRDAHPVGVSKILSEQEEAEAQPALRV